jgi:hypothetical protein
MARRIFNLPGHVVAACIEALVLTKAFPQKFPAQNAFVWAFIRLLGLHLAVIVSFFFFYLGLIYPYFVSPIRHFPATSVSISPLARIRYVLFFKI